MNKENRQKLKENQQKHKENQQKKKEKPFNLFKRQDLKPLLN